MENFACVIHCPDYILCAMKCTTMMPNASDEVNESCVITTIKLHTAHIAPVLLLSVLNIIVLSLSVTGNAG